MRGTSIDAYIHMLVLIYTVLTDSVIDAYIHMLVLTYTVLTYSVIDAYIHMLVLTYTWYMVYDVYGVWCMVYGAWYMVYGVRCTVYGTWYMLYGAVPMVRLSLSKPLPMPLQVRLVRHICRLSWCVRSGYRSRKVWLARRGLHRRVAYRVGRDQRLYGRGGSTI
jgi:hypothetical protein